MIKKNIYIKKIKKALQLVLFFTRKDKEWNKDTKKLGDEIKTLNSVHVVTFTAMKRIIFFVKLSYQS